MSLLQGTAHFVLAVAGGVLAGAACFVVGQQLLLSMVTAAVGAVVLIVVLE